MAHLRGIGGTLCALLVAAFLTPAYSQDNLQLVEQEIKAGLLYNFLKYTQWPSDDARRGNGNAVVCLLGGDPFDGHLQPMAGRTVNQHSIEIRNVSGAREINSCTLLYIHANQRLNWPQLEKALAGKDILTVSDFAGFAESGGMIELTRVNDRIGVTINIDAVTAAHLTVAGRLLRLASTVHTAAD